MSVRQYVHSLFFDRTDLVKIKPETISPLELMVCDITHLKNHITEGLYFEGDF